MGETLFIRLGSQENDKIHWLIKTNGQDEVIASGELPNAKELKQLTEKSSTREVVAFVPACDIAMKSLTVPGASKRAIRMAAPYMLEDDLAQDVEQLFFAFSEQKDNAQGHNCFLAAVEREQLAKWQAWLKDAGIFCKLIQPDALALPFDDTASAITLGEQTLLRSAPWQAMAFEHDAWPIIVNKLNNDNHLTINAYSTLPHVGTDLNINQLPEELPLALLAMHYSNKFNLLQGQFKIKEKRSATHLGWYWAAGLFLFAITLNMALKGAELFQISAQQSVIEEEIIDSYKATFPKTKRVKVSTVRSQLRQKLKEIGSSSNGAGFLPLLIRLEPALSKVPQIKPQTLKFDGKRKEIRMQTTAKDYQYFERLKVALEQSGLKVTLGAQSNQGDQISGSFSITQGSTRERS